MQNNRNIANLSVERVVLSSLAFQPELLEDYVLTITENDFYYPFHREFYKILIKLFYEKKIIMMDIIKDELISKNYYSEKDFTSIYLEAPVVQLELYVKELKEKTVKRELLKLSEKIKHSIFEEEINSQDLLDFVENRMFKISQNRFTGEFKDINQILNLTEEYINKMRNRENKTVTGVTTGFDSLNIMTTGFNEGDLIVLAARPAMGKTALSLNIVYNILINGGGVAFFSLEMPVEQLMLRLLSLDSWIPLQKIRTGELNEDEFETIANSLNKFKNYKLFVDDDGGTNINALKTKLRKLKTQHPDIALAVIDYLQIMSSSNNRDRHIEVADMSRGLKLLARELKMPILALSQLNRGLESRNDKRPIMSDLRESGAIEQDADIILFVYRDDIYRIKAEKEKEKEARNNNSNYRSDFQEKEIEEAEIIIGKQRNGPTGIIKLNFIKKYTKFVEQHENTETEFIPETTQIINDDFGSI